MATPTGEDLHAFIQPDIEFTSIHNAAQIPGAILSAGPPHNDVTQIPKRRQSFDDKPP